MHQISHRAFDLAEVDGVSSVGISDERPFVSEIVELQRHALSVRFMHAKSQGSERRRQKRCVQRFFVFRLQFVIEQILQHEQAGDVCFGFFNGRMRIF